MTTLDDFLFFAKSKSILAALQVTPSRLKILTTENGFWEIIEEISEKKIIFKFLEQREVSLDLHLVFLIRKREIEVSIRISNPQPPFLYKIREIFPSSFIFVQGILKN